MIVKKMAGQAQYKGSFANGIRSLSLPNWRESFTVSGSMGFNSRAKNCKKILFRTDVSVLFEQNSVSKTEILSIFKLLVAFQWASQRKM